MLDVSSTGSKFDGGGDTDVGVGVVGPLGCGTWDVTYMYVHDKMAM